MTERAGDRWLVGDAYEAYMGRWSRPLARVFIEWLQPTPAAHWLEIGCGTGALTSTVCGLGDPASIVACDPSESFVAHARAGLDDSRVSFVVADSSALPHRDKGFDLAVSGLVLNFLPDPQEAVASIRERMHLGATIAAYVWDYSDGMEFLRVFWDEAAALDPRAVALHEGGRFPLCTGAAMESLFKKCGLSRVETSAIEIPTRFEAFDDYWRPFLQGTGPAPSYVSSLDAPGRDRLKHRLEQRLPVDGDGHISLRARAWAARGLSM